MKNLEQSQVQAKRCTMKLKILSNEQQKHEAAITDMSVLQHKSLTNPKG